MVIYAAAVNLEKSFAPLEDMKELCISKNTVFLLLIETTKLPDVASLFFAPDAFLEESPTMNQEGRRAPHPSRALCNVDVPCSPVYSSEPLASLSGVQR